MKLANVQAAHWPRVQLRDVVSYRAAWWSLFALGAALRLWRLDAANLWYDEAGTIWMASLDLPRMLSATAADVHPPLYLFLEWMLIHSIGMSAALVRLPSVAFSLSALWVARLIAERLQLSRAAILAATALMAFSPFQLSFAQEARMYALLQLAALVTLLAVLDRNWLLAAVAGAAMLYTHNYGVIYLAGFALLAVVREVWQPLGYAQLDYVMLAFTAPVMVWLPWAVVILQQMQSYAADWIQPVTAGGFLFPFYLFVWSLGLPDAAQAGGAILVFGLILLALVKMARTGSAAAWTLAFAAFAAPAMAALASAAWRPIYLHRPLIGAAAPLYLLIGWAIAEVAGPWRRAWLATLIAPTMLIAVIGYYPEVVRVKSDGRETADIITARWQAGDVVYHVNVGSLQSLWPYTPAAIERESYLMPQAGHNYGTLNKGSRDVMGMVELPLEAVMWRRAWLVWMGGPTVSAAEDAAKEAILKRYSSELIETLGDGRVTQGGLWLLSR